MECEAHTIHVGIFLLLCCLCESGFFGGLALQQCDIVNEQYQPIDHFAIPVLVIVVLDAVTTRDQIAFIEIVERSIVLLFSGNERFQRDKLRVIFALSICEMVLRCDRKLNLSGAVLVRKNRNIPCKPACYHAVISYVLHPEFLSFLCQWIFYFFIFSTGPWIRPYIVFNP